jgi:hypothetical protein
MASPSAAVKLKSLLCCQQLLEKGNPHFQKELQMNANAIRACLGTHSLVAFLLDFIQDYLLSVLFHFSLLFFTTRFPLFLALLRRLRARVAFCVFSLVEFRGPSDPVRGDTANKAVRDKASVCRVETEGIVSASLFVCSLCCLISFS